MKNLFFVLLFSVLLAAVVAAASAVASADSASAVSDVAPSKVSTTAAPPKSDGTISPAVPPITPSKSDGTKSPPVPPISCTTADYAYCSKYPAPAPKIDSCASVSSVADSAACITKTINSGSLGVPAIDPKTMQKRPTSTTSCVLTPNSFSILAGASRVISISCFNADGVIACPSMSWSATIGSVDGTIPDGGATYYASSSPGSGSVSAAGIGSDGVAFSCGSSVAVTAASVPVSCYLSPPSLTIGVNQQQTFAISCSDDAGNEIACPGGMTWTATIGTVVPDPAIGAAFYSGSTAGTGIVRATGRTPTNAISDGVVGTFNCQSDVTVTSAPPTATACTLDPSSLTIGVNQQQTFAISCSDDAGNEIACPGGMTWTATIGTVTPDPTIGAAFYSGSTAGSGAVTASSLTKTAFSCSSPVTVTSAPQTVRSCTLNPSSLTIATGGQQVFMATCYGTDGVVSCTSDLSWSTDVGTLSPGPAKSQSITFTAQSTAGSGSITAGGTNDASAKRSGAKAAPASYSCNAPISVTSSVGQIASVQLVPSSATLSIGQTQKFMANAYDAKGNFIRTLSNSEVAWSLISIAIADVGTIDSNGLFTALSTGSTTVRGTYVAITPGALIYGEAPVTVTTALPATTCALSPSSLVIGVNQQQAFEVRCYNAGGEIACPPMGWSSTIGTITASPSPSVVQIATFSSGSSSGTGEVRAAPIASPVVSFSCAAPVTVNAAIGSIASIVLSPSSVSLYTGQTQQFIAAAYDANGNYIRNLANSEVTWAVNNSVGTISSSGVFTAVGIGTTTVRGTYNAITPTQVIYGEALVSVSSLPVPPGGGGGVGGGSNNGGGSFRTSTTVSLTCEKQPAKVAITYYDSSAPAATVGIYYKGASGTTMVFSQTLTTTTSLSFTPQLSGDYEVRVTLGTDQNTASFYVPQCTPQTLNITRNVTVRLASERELVLSKTVRYSGGFTKTFEVYKVAASGAESYETDITMSYLNSGASALTDFTITDTVPLTVLSKASQITFENYPGSLTSDPAPSFDWNVKTLAPGGRVQFKYSFGRMLTEAMISKFASPTLMTSTEREELIKTSSQQQGGDLLAASLGSFAGLDLSVSVLLVIIFGLVLAFLVYTFVFAKKPVD